MSQQHEAFLVEWNTGETTVEILTVRKDGEHGKIRDGWRTIAYLSGMINRGSYGPAIVKAIDKVCSDEKFRKLAMQDTYCKRHSSPMEDGICELCLVADREGL